MNEVKLNSINVEEVRDENGDQKGFLVDISYNVNGTNHKISKNLQEGVKAIGNHHPIRKQFLEYFTDTQVDGKGSNVDTRFLFFEMFYNGYDERFIEIIYENGEEKIIKDYHIKNRGIAGKYEIENIKLES